MASPMTPERFQDRFEAFCGEPQQVPGVWTLHAAIAALPGSEAILGGVWSVVSPMLPAIPSCRCMTPGQERIV